MAKNNRDFFKVKCVWSEVKDRLLGGYLPQYFQKLLTSYKPIFYVDCFAGKGRFEDGSKGSPCIALDVRDECLQKTKVINAQIETCFIDKNYALELGANIACYNGQYGSPRVISGKYEENIGGLLKAKRNSNIFLYIDPYGIKALDMSMFDDFALGFNSIEMLINMNSFGFFRDACRAMCVSYDKDEALNNLDDIVEYEPTQVDASQQSEELLSRIAGGDYWKKIVIDYSRGKIDGYGAEKRFSAEYKKRLRQSYTYVLDMPIRLKSSIHPKYRMIHVCNHVEGCILMADNMASRHDELVIDIQHYGQTSLFNTDIENKIIYSSDIEQRVNDKLVSICDWISVNKFIADFFTEYEVMCKSGKIKQVLKELEKLGQIEVYREPSITGNGNVTNTFTESTQQKVLIRRR